MIYLMIICLMIVQPTPVLAQDVLPDVGTVLESTKTPAPKPPSKKPRIEFLQPQGIPGLQAGAGGAVGGAQEVKIQVADFAITGMTVFTQHELSSQIAGMVGQQLSLGELQGAADKITQYYRSKGYFASYAYIPVQDIVANVVNIKVLEGRLGAIRITDAERIGTDTIRGFLQPAMSDALLQAAPMERSLLLINDLPGLDVTSEVQRGKAPGTADIILKIKEKGDVFGSVEADNFGSYYIGRQRLTLSANIANGMLGMGEELALRGTRAGNGMQHGSVAFSLPINYRGTRAGLTLSTMDYQVRKEFRFLESQGKTETANLFVSHPFIRARHGNLTARLDLNYSDMKQNMLGEMTRQDKPKEVGISLSGDRRDNWFGGGANQFSCGGSYGKNVYASALFDDPPPEDDRFAIFNWRISRTQQLLERLSFTFLADGQYSRNQLISSKQLSLGGPQKIRAYPVGEGKGDRGYRLTGELRWDITQNGWFGTRVELMAFADTGNVYFNGHDKKDVDLTGAGVGLNMYSAKYDALLRINYAWREGSDRVTAKPRNDPGRFWVQLAHFFDF